MRRFIVAVLGVAALAGCSATAGSQAATTTTTPDVTAIWRELVQCLRDNGMPNLPDPRIDADGQPHFPGGDPGDPPPQAERACMPIYNRLPASVREGGPQQEGGEASRPPADIPALLRLARCMREQGMPDWPDPKADGTFPLAGTAFEREGKSPRFLKAARACARFNPDPRGASMEAETVPTRRRARTGLLAAALVVALLAAGGWAAVRGGGLGRPATAAAAPEIPTGTAVVARTDVVSRQRVPGTLGYEGSFTVVGHVGGADGGGQAHGGTVTRLPAPGAVLRRGRAVYELDGRPVPLWYGRRPAWRGFQSGMVDGTDVRALEANLVALGFDPDRAITVDRHFTAATSAAVRRWQGEVLGLPPALRSGAIPLGGVVFLPGPVRIAAVAATVGATVQPGTPILTATSTRPVVSVSLPPSFQQLVRRGARVQVILPDGTATPGRVATVSRAAVVPDPAAGQEGQGQGQGGGPEQATIPLTARLTKPGAAKGLDQAPVGVAITTETHRGVLAVPVVALLAEPGGGYAVEVVEGGARRRVPVRTDLFDESSGVVEVDGPGPAEGTTVVVPAR